MSYPEAVNLPFNMKVLADRFRWVHPGEAPPPGEPCWCLVRGAALIVLRDGAGCRLPQGALPSGVSTSGESICFGTWDGQPLLAAVVAKGDLPAELVEEPFNALEDRLDDLLLSIGGIARQVLGWRRESARCGRCGGEMVDLEGSWGRRCSACGTERFPAVHPCAIVLVRRGDEFLLARKKEWPAGRYGLVAGFLDLGESLEECAAREVLEETGIQVKNVRYVGSQHWPFPSQLMAGFVADYAGGELKVDAAELEDARWFCREELPASLPGKRSIARWIIDRYLLHRPA